ncbi:MAG: hypothetical protein AUK48_11470 [Oscillatoriales cyanobacterium CG2_30_44_21]|nr:MAG: hypothetical protein AUK48_11470 [Oscillatoriales cyanobacterium CG2_30_44_21]
MKPLNFLFKFGTLKTIGLLAIASFIFAIEANSAVIASDLSDQPNLTSEQVPSLKPNLLADSGNNLPNSPLPTNNSPLPTPETNPEPTSPKTVPQILILSPSMDTLSDVPAVTVILRLPIGAEAELMVNGRTVNNNAIGRTDVDTTAKTVTQTWYGVVLDEGENVITAKIIGGEAIATTRVKLRGAATQLQISTLESRIPADGRSTATVQGLLLDEKGDRSNRGAMITLTASDGEFIGTDAQADQPGFQVEARDGQFSALLKSSLTSGYARIRATARFNNREAEAFTQLQFETNLRPSIVTGVIDLRIGARGTDFYRSFRDFLPSDRDNSTNVDFYAAAFGTGSAGEWLITGALNTRRSLNEDCEGRSRLFRDTQSCQQVYPTYGDSSTYTTEAPSLTSVFLRAERTSPVPNAGTDYLMWGDYRTSEFASRSQEYTAFTRQLNGLKLNYNFGDLQATGFYSSNTKGFQRDIIPPDGTSGFYFLSRRLVTPGSENVFIEWEEILRPGTIVRRVQLERSKDYEIDYDRGSLQFRQPISQTDIGDNGETLVRRIVASYEYDNENGSTNSVYGGQLRYNFQRNADQPSWLGVNYYKEDQGSRDFQLYGANALFSFGRNAYVIGEYARSENQSLDLAAPVSGSALRFEAIAEVAQGIMARGFYRQTDTGFVNNATISFTPGQTRYGLSVDAKLSDSTTLRAAYDREENRGIAPQPFTLTSFLELNPQSTPGSPVDNSLSTFSFGLIQKLGFATAELDLLMRDRQDFLNNSFTSNSTQLRSRLTLPLADNLKFIVLNETSLSNSSDSVLPDRTALSLDWQFIEGFSFRLGQQWFNSGVLANNNFTTAEVVGDYKLGSDTTLSGRYSIVGGANSTTTQGAIGLNQRWAIAPGLRLNLGYERIFGDTQVANASGRQVLQPLTTGTNTSTLALQSGDNYNIGLEYSDNPDFKASARYEYRNSSTGSNTVLSASALGKLTPALTSLFRYQRSGVANQTINNFGDTSSIKLGLAYRDPNNDSLNALLRYEYRQNPSTIPNTLASGFGTGTEESVLALEAIYAPTWQWEFYGKYAFRNSTTFIAQDFVGNSVINLAQLRATYRLGYNFDLTGEARLINQPTAGFSETGFLGEVGYYPTPNLRLALGYSSGAVNNDRDFSGTRSAGGIYAAVTIKLNELFDGFGLQRLEAPQYKEPVDPQTPITLPTVNKPTNPATRISQAPPTPEMMRIALAQPIQFPSYQANLSPISQVILDNLVLVLREYPALNIEVQGNLASLSQTGTVASTEVQRLGLIRTYLLNNGITAGRVTMRSLGAAANPEADAEVYLSIGGTRDTFAQIANRLAQGQGNAALQSLLPDIAKQENINPVAAVNVPQVAAIAQVIEFAPIGKMTDVSNANLDALIKRVADRADIAIEIKGNLDGSELEVNRLMGLRSYLLQKGISSDRILISNSDGQTQANRVTVTLASLEGLPIAKLPDDLPDNKLVDVPSVLTPVVQRDQPANATSTGDRANNDRANNNRFSLLLRDESKLDAQLSGFTVSQFSFSGNALPVGESLGENFSLNDLEINDLAQSSFFLLGQLLDLDKRLALLPRLPKQENIFNSPVLFTDFNDQNILSFTPIPNLLLGQLLDPNTRQPLALLPPNLLPSTQLFNSPQILSLLLDSSRFSFLVSAATTSENLPRFSFPNASADTSGILWSYQPTDQLLSLLLTEPKTLVSNSNTPDLRTQRFISALNFLLNRDRDSVLASWLNSLNGQQSEIRGELIKPELFEEAKL